MVKIVITTNKENSDDATLFYFLLACHLSSPPSSPFLGRVLLKLKLFCSNLPYFPYSVLPEAALLAPSDPCVVIGSWGPWEQEIIMPRSRWWTTFTTNTLPGRWASTTKGRCASWSTAAAGVWATKLPQVWSGWRACLEWSKLQHDLVTDRKFQHQKYHFLPLVKSIPSCLARGCLAFCLLDFASLSAMISFKPKW